MFGLKLVKVPLVVGRVLLFAALCQYCVLFATPLVENLNPLASAVKSEPFVPPEFVSIIISILL